MTVGTLKIKDKALLFRRKNIVESKDEALLFRRKNIVESALYVNKKWVAIYGA
jgi:hypothetical protein